MELLSKRVWKHTMLLFLCDEDVEDPIINKHIQNANRLLEKCGNRHFVLRSEAQVPEFLQEVEKVVEGNCDDFFLPQIYHNYMQIKGPQNVTEMKMNEDREEELKRGYQTRTGAYNTKQAGNNALRQRCGSLQGDRPSINDDDQTVDTVATKSKFWKDHKPAIALALTGDLVGSETTVNQYGHNKGTLTSRRKRRYEITKDHTVSVSELRIVLLGQVGAGKSKVARFLLDSKKPEGEIGSCIMLKGKVAGRRILLVDTPGWSYRDIYNTPENMKNEIIRSVTLCPPGPHALIVVLCLESFTDAPSTKELKVISEHMKLLSERAWKHTMLLFLCDKDMGDPIINEHIQKANGLLEKCGNRHFVLHSEAQVTEFLQEIEKMVEENCGDFFLPQIYYDYMQKKTPHNVADMIKMYEEREEQLKRACQKRITAYDKKQTEEAMLRRGSLDGHRPGMKGDNQTVGNVASKIRYWVKTLEQHLLSPAVVLILICALFLMVESVYGFMGLGVGIFIGAVTIFHLTGSASLKEGSSKTEERDPSTLRE
ncbi:hypothetical protein NFI96_016151 [Prochilodus magdalenae]|nr:hypothetical protein NFI96_016151 [Prochilodus magdalenae]